MKRLLPIFMFASISSFAQYRTDTSAWVPIDTFSRYSDLIGWEYSNWVQDSIYRKQDTIVQVIKQMRVGKKSGILQAKYAYVYWWTMPPQKSTFEIVMDSIAK